MIITVALLVALVALIYQFFSWNFGYWRKRDVPGPKPALFTGNYPNLYTMKRHAIYDLREIYRKYKENYDAVGIYLGRTPQLLVVSPELAHRVFVTDFKHFNGNEMARLIDEKSDYILSNNIFTMFGDKWKRRRADVTPGLTMSRTKSVYPVTTGVCRKLTDYVRRKTQSKVPDGMNAKELCLRFTTEVVTDCVLGMGAQSFSDNPTPVVDKINSLFSDSLGLMIIIFVVSLVPSLLRFKKLKLVPQHVEDFFVNVMQSAIDARQSQLAAGKQIETVDFLDYILQLAKKHNLNTREVTAHSMTFLLDGFETTATVLSHALLFVGRHPEYQQRLRDEIREYLNEQGHVDFDRLNEMQFLDAFLQETMRIFPAVVVSNKLCTETIQVPNRNGSNFTIEKGTVVIVPHSCFMLDEDYFPNPDEFQPERFMEPNAAKTYKERGVFMAFGDGPRSCIGMRFAMIQIKAALVEIVTNFNVKVNPRTRKDNMFDAFGVITKLQGDVWLDFEARNY